MAGTSNKRPLIYESVLEHIKARLLKGELEPGSRLPTVAVLAEQLDVGTASVREAYRILESQGILEVTQGRGTFVSSAISDSGDVFRHFQLAEHESLAHLLEARKLLEPGIAALAAQRATTAEADAITDAAQAAEQSPPNVADFAEENIRFHDLVASAAHNPVAARMLTAIHDLIRDVQPLAAQIPDSAERAIHFHKLIAIAIKAGNPDAAHAFMCQHIESFEEALKHLKREDRGSSAEQVAEER
jgi:GntR family transcriptional repressor for pyruvate dehydrogenase complex